MSPNERSERDENEERDQLIEILETAYPTETPAPEAKARIRRELERRGAIRSPHRRRLVYVAGAAAAAAILIGLVLARQEVTMHSVPSQKAYVLLLDTVTPDYSNMDAEAAEALAERYRAWAEELVASGHLKESYYLRSTSSTEGLEAVSGIVVIEADSIEDARRLAASSPHLQRGGHISIRELATLR